MINKNRLVALTQKLIQINSENPPGDETAIVEFIKKDLLSFGLKPEIYEFKKNRPNIIYKTGSGKKSLLISPHLDTVPAGKNWKFGAFSGKVFNGKIYGRGATDCKCNLAVSLEVLKSLIEDKISLDYNLIFAATADEETGSRFGLIPLLKKNILHPDFALILDADEFDIIVSQKGLIHFTLTVFGKKAHGAYPERGINAITLTSNIIQLLKKFKFHCKINPLLKPPTINFGKISGGDKVNIVASWCQLEIDLRFLPGSNPNVILNAIKKTIRKVTKKFRVKIDDLQNSYTISKDNFFVKSLIQTNKKFGISAGVRGSEGATVITFFQDKRIPAIATGFGTKGTAHADDEYVKINNLYKGALVLEEFIKKFQP